jgi:hypothetical protein
MIELDTSGKVVHSWGDRNLIEGTVAGFRLGPVSNRLHTCHFDKDNNVWIASSPSGMIQKYTHDGSKLLQQIGKKGEFDSADGTSKGAPLNSNAARFYAPASIHVDRENGDIYVADGETEKSNRRIMVLDASGNFLRQWQPEGMDSVHCMTIADDGTVYVCNRTARASSFTTRRDASSATSTCRGSPSRRQPTARSSRAEARLWRSRCRAIPARA